MLNLDNIDLQRQFTSEMEAINAIRSYIYQLYIELDYRLDNIGKEIESIKAEREENS